MSTKRIIIGIVVLLIAASAWYLASPLFLSTTVNEDLPGTTPELTVQEEEMLDAMESMTPEQVEALPEAERMEMKEKMEEISKKMPDEPMDEPLKEEPQTIALATGSFKDQDSFHKGSGTATVYSLPNGSRVLRFENFRVTNGPALNVYLVKDASGDVESGYVDLGKLKGNIGNQNYEIPANVDLSQYKSVVIWCVTFSVTFSVAELQ